MDAFGRLFAAKCNLCKSDVGSYMANGETQKYDRHTFSRCTIYEGSTMLYHHTNKYDCFIDWHARYADQQKTRKEEKQKKKQRKNFSVFFETIVIAPTIPCGSFFPLTKLSH